MGSNAVGGVDVEAEAEAEAGRGGAMPTPLPGCMARWANADGAVAVAVAPAAVYLAMFSSVASSEPAAVRLGLISVRDIARETRVSYVICRFTSLLSKKASANKYSTSTCLLSMLSELHLDG
jgi:hypothetical protein